MKHNNQVIKSLDELSPELLGFEAANSIREQTTTAEAELVEQNTHKIFQPVSFLPESEIRAYRGWGINE